MTKLAEWRKEQHLTLMQAATLLGVSISTYCAWEKGRGGMRVSHLVKVSEKTGLPMGTIVEEVKINGKGGSNAE